MTTILPIQLFGFDCKVIDEIIDAVKEEEYKDKSREGHLNKQSADTFLHKSHTVLGEYTQRCNDEMWDYIKHEGDGSRLVTTQCWMNKTYQGQHHPHHTHPNSVVSGILYLTDSSTPTIFTNVNMYKAGFIQVYPAQEHHDTHKLAPMKGRTVMFPSAMTHVVPEHTEDTARITISWNTFLEGDVSREDRLMGFSIKVN